VVTDTPTPCRPPAAEAPLPRASKLARHANGEHQLGLGGFSSGVHAKRVSASVVVVNADRPVDIAKVTLIFFPCPASASSAGIVEPE
jgi:hypothetical protein